MINAIDHINIKTPDVAGTVEFYSALFDLTVGPALTMADQQRNLWLSTADGRALIHVNVAEDRVGSSGKEVLDHVAFDCSDAAAMRRRLEDLGVSYHQLESRLAGLEQIFLTDPNGVRVELTFRS